MNVQPRIAVEEIVGKACSDPGFIMMINLIIKLSEAESQLPPHTLTVIGGAAFILHAYLLNGRNLQRMQEAIRAVPQTSDIDIAVWYDHIIDRDTFLRKNNMMAERIRENFTIMEGRIRNLLLQKMKELVAPSIIDTFEIEVRKPVIRKDFEYMTTSINVVFIINGQRFKVIDIAMKNPIYSQNVKSGINRRQIPVEQNVTHTTKRNTTILIVRERNNSSRLPIDYVRVPTIQRLIEQQEFALKQEPAKLYKYKPRIDYLKQHSGLSSAAPLGSAAALDDVRAQFARAEQDTRTMFTALPVPASHLGNSALPPLPPRQGGKRRTYIKNKRHTKRHTKRR